MTTNIAPPLPSVKIPGNTLITATPEEGRTLAIELALSSVEAIQPDPAARERGRAVYASDPDSVIAAAEVIAREFATVAKANNYWRH
ncbi:hexameric tyrosine-coordinated heme protein [Cellulomonas sp. P22]|uniref:hexameric tyrosine-coordinated heme protein n=1 Tax=Cellulomonas sp. P22 TaxID=3373189 RepID=UPI0037950C1D